MVRSYVQGQPIVITAITPTPVVAGQSATVDLPTMASEDVLNQKVETMIDDKVTTLKEELEEMIEEVKNEVEETGTELSNNRENQTMVEKKLTKAMEKLRKELQQFGELILFL